MKIALQIAPLILLALYLIQGYRLRKIIYNLVLEKTQLKKKLEEEEEYHNFLANGFWENKVRDITIELFVKISVDQLNVLESLFPFVPYTIYCKKPYRENEWGKIEFGKTRITFDIEVKDA